MIVDKVKTAVWAVAATVTGCCTTRLTIYYEIPMGSFGWTIEGFRLAVVEIFKWKCLLKLRLIPKILPCFLVFIKEIGL